MKKKSYRFFLFLLIHLGIQLALLLPKPVLFLLARGIGLCICTLLGKERRKVETHLQMAFHDQLSEEQRDRLAKRVFIHVALVVVEMLSLYHLSLQKLAKLVQMSEVDRQRIYKIADENKGLIIATAHFGNWEVLGTYVKNILFPDRALLVIAKKSYYDRYNDMLIRFRERFGVTTVYRDTSFLHLVKRLKGGDCIGVLTDQDIQSVPGIFVDFFGRTAYTSDSQARLAVISGAPILPLFLIREGAGFRILMGEPIRISREANRADELVRVTQEIARVTEHFIRAHPEQWVWMHRRWKTRPEDVTAPVN